MIQIIQDILKESIEAKTRFIDSHSEIIVKAADRIAQCLASGHKLLLFGNGGSAADAQHIAAEFVNRFQTERPPLAAIALTTDTSVITSIGNDYHFDDIFSKQVQAIGKKDDIAVGISTSGNSPNVIKALQTAKDMELGTIGLSGGKGKIAEYADFLLAVAAQKTARIQETHILAGHLLCDLVDRLLFPMNFSEKENECG